MTFIHLIFAVVMVLYFVNKFVFNKVEIGDFSKESDDEENLYPQPFEQTTFKPIRNRVERAKPASQTSNTEQVTSKIKSRIKDVSQDSSMASVTGNKRVKLSKEELKKAVIYSEILTTKF